MKNGDMPASPIFNEQGFPSLESGNKDSPISGLTKRETFAMVAMQGLLSAVDGEGTWTGLDCSDQAVKEADALLAALESKQ